MNRCSLVLLALASLFLAADPAMANISVLVPTPGATSLSVGFGRFGQSFTATEHEPQASIVSFRYYSLNSHLTDPVMTARLYDGTGFDGALLGTSNTYTVPFSNLSSWIDFEFSPPIPLTVGNTYSILFSHEGTGSHSGGYASSQTDIDYYPGGSRLSTFGNPSTPENPRDLSFRVFALPEPGTLALVSLAAMWALATSRRRSG